MRLWPKSGWAQAGPIIGIVLVCLLAIWLVYADAMHRYYYDHLPTEGLYSALESYVTRHDGNMPPGWRAFLDDAAANPSENGVTFQIGYEETEIAITGGWERSLNDFEVKFGARPDELRIVGDAVQDNKGDPVTLFRLRNPASTSDKDFQRWSFGLAKAMIEASHRPTPATTPQQARQR
jgi:hypothetical protein